MIDCSIIWVLTCGVIGGAAIWIGQHLGYKRGYSIGYGDGKLNISSTHAFDMGRAAGLREGEARLTGSQAYDMGRKAGQRETAAFLAGSEIPAVSAVGKSLLAEGWGK
jgi:hypothetical protein